MITRHLRVVTATDAAPAPEKKKHKAVVDGELIYTSVSQLQKFTPEVGGCPSKWFFRYVLGLPDDPPGKGQIRGTQGHSRIEDYLEDGIDVLDNLERRGKKFMPEPNVRPDGSRHPVPVLVEAHFGPVHEDASKKRTKAPFTQLTAEGVPVVGFIDLIDPRDPRWLWLKDWKFKKSISLYGTKPHELLNPRTEAGIQIIGYLEALRLAHVAGVFSQSWAIPAHVTFQTGGAPEVVETTPVEEDGVTVKTIQLDSAKALWETVTHAAIPGMRKAARAKSHTEVPKNEKVCHKYRKACPYIGTCLDRMARIRQGFKSKAPAPAVPAVQTEGSLMRMLQQMTGTVPPASTVTPAPIQSQSAPPPAVKQAPGQAQLTAALAQPNSNYLVKGTLCRFLTRVDMGGTSYASFTPTAGGPPVLAGLEEPISAADAPIVTPPDAPKSNPVAAAAEPSAQLVSKCALGDKYEMPGGGIGEYTGSSRDVGFFQTTAGTVKLALTDSVKALPAAPAPKIEATAQGSTPASNPAGNPPQSAEAPKGEGSPSGAEVKPAAEPEDKPKRKKVKIVDKSETPDETLRALAAAAAPPAPLALAVGVLNAVPTQTHTPDGDLYGALEGVRLYLGCTPVGVAAQTLGPYVDQLERALMKGGQLNICDIRVAQDATFGFNKWKGFLSQMALESPPPPGHYVSLGYADERVACVAEALAARIAALHPGNVVKAG